MSKVAVQILSWNGEKYLRPLLDSLAAQTYQDFELLILDNGSTDGSVSIIEGALKTFARPSRFFKTAENIGFAAGHDRLFAETDSEYVLCVNQDTELTPAYLEKLVAYANAHPRVGAVSGKLLCGQSEGYAIDSAGLLLRWYGAVADIGTRNKDDGQYDGIREVFGVSGAIPLYRRFAALDASLDGALFEHLFFAYKEDVDLAWRLRLRGWQAFVVGEAVAFHVRSFAKGRTRDGWRQRLSVRNHLYVLIKNFPAKAWPCLLGVIVYELAKVAYLLIRDARSLTGYTEVWQMLPMIRKHRKVNQSRTTADIRKWLK